MDLKTVNLLCDRFFNDRQKNLLMAMYVFLIIREPLSQPFGVVEIMGERTPSTNTLQFDKLITQR